MQGMDGFCLLSADFGDVEAVPCLHSQKIVYLIRHGESRTNAIPERDRHHPKFRDVQLSEKGLRQARTVAASLLKSSLLAKIQVVLTSPLRRCLQTACLMFAEFPKTKIVAWAVITELFPDRPESQGRPPDQIANCPDLKDLPRFKEIEIGHLAAEWWSVSGDKLRIQEFIDWISCCPQTRIAVVSHFGFINEVLKHQGCALRNLENCAILRTVWGKE